MFKIISDRFFGLFKQAWQISNFSGHIYDKHVIFFANVLQMQN